MVGVDVINYFPSALILVVCMSWWSHRDPCQWVKNVCIYRLGCSSGRGRRSRVSDGLAVERGEGRAR